MLVTDTGETGVLEERWIERPTPGIGEVRVRVAAAGVNPVDVGVRRGSPLGRPVPFVPGWDVSGVVDAVGPGVTIHRPGDPVFGMLPFPRGMGAYAEYAVAPARALVRKPERLTHVQAAALPLAGLTAWQSLVDTAGVGADSRVAITAAAGGVGHLAVQIAVARGAEVVAVASAHHAEYLRALGVSRLIDARSADFATELRDLDAVLDCVGGDYPLRAIPTLSPGGTLVTLAPQSVAAASAAAAERGVRAVGLFVESDGEGMRRLAALSDSGELVPTIAAERPLADAAAAQLAPHGSGKVVLTVD